MWQNLFFWILVPLGGRGGHAYVGKVCYKCTVHILKSNKNSIFFASTSNLCRAMLPNYFRTYSCALCQIRALEKAFQTMAKAYLKSWFWMHACDWPKQTVKIYMQYSTYFFCNNDLCRAMLQDYLGTHSWVFCQLWAWEKKGIWEE